MARRAHGELRCAGKKTFGSRRAQLLSAGRPLWRRVLRRASSSPGQLWDEVGEDNEDFLDAPKQASRPGQAGILENFAEGADFGKAKIFAATRTFAVAPWSEDVKAKPIFAVSDSTGSVAKRIAINAFRQFGSSFVIDDHVEVMAEIRTEEAVRDVLAKAARLAPKGALAIEKSGAMLVYTLASQKLGTFLAEEAHKLGVPCINALEPVLLSMERRFGLQRSVSQQTAQIAGFESEGLTVFAVSDSTGTAAHAVAQAALKQFPTCGVETVTVCSAVRSLEEVNQIVEEALGLDSMIIFTFASPGMSRFMRQQCERAKVPYADVFQPVVIALERYLNFPPVGIAGGHDLKASPSARLKWQRRPLQG